MPSSSKPSGIPITTVILSPKNGLPRTSIPTSSMPAGLANKSPSSQNAGHEEQRPNARASHNPRCSPDAHLFLGVSLEDVAVHRDIDDEGRSKLAAAQTGNEGLGHPMPKRRLCAKPLAFEAAAAQTGHLGCASGLADEDEPMRLKLHVRLACGGPARPKSPFALSRRPAQAGTYSRRRSCARRLSGHFS